MQPPISNPQELTSQIGQSRAIPFTSRLTRLPWWALVMALLGVLFAWVMATDRDYQTVFGAISSGVSITILVTLAGYVAAVLLGLLIALGRVLRSGAIYQVATFYVELIRGLPLLVLLLYVAFVIIPAVIQGIGDLGTKMVSGNILIFIAQPLSQVRLRDFNEIVRVIIALAIAYSAFLSEDFRAGIESIDAGQMEAARALGMSYWQAMRHIILRQAFRQVLPVLGNEFISMLKDSSLVSILGVHDITLQGKLYSASTYLVFQTYNVVAYLYLVMTLMLSLVVKWIERRMARERRKN